MMRTEKKYPLFTSRILGALLGSILIFHTTGTGAAIISQGSTAQESRAMAIGHLCEGWVIAYARNPALEDSDFRPQIESALKEIKKATLFQFGSRENLGQAIGKIRGAQLVATARNPSLKEGIDNRADACIAVIKGRKLKIEE